MKSDEAQPVSAEQSPKFSWLICQSRDDEGGVVAYGCRTEDSAKIFENPSRKRLTKAHKRNYPVVGNRVTLNANDYCVLQPRLVSGPNRNQIEVAFDTFGMVKAKPLPTPIVGGMLTGFVDELTQALLDAFFNTAELYVAKAALLKDAITIIYDLDRFRCTQQAYLNYATQWQSACTVPRVRKTSNSPLSPKSLKIQLSFSYVNGYGAQDPEESPGRTKPIRHQRLTGSPMHPCWVSNGWTVFNNKGKPVL